MKINVMGTSGSGKSTFSKNLSKKINHNYIEMDELHWKSDWVESTSEEFFKKLKKKLSSENWILDGNYYKAQDIKWEKINQVIFLDLPLWLVLFRVIRRSISRAIKREKLWHGNKESLLRLFFSKESMIVHTVRTFQKNKYRFNELSRSKKYKYIEFIKLKSQKEVDEFLSNYRLVDGKINDS